MTEFVVVALTIVIVFLPGRSLGSRGMVTFILLLWLAVLSLAIQDLPNAGRWSDLLGWSPVTALLVAPVILLGRWLARRPGSAALQATFQS